jgi:hypothetical protein
MMAVFLVRDGDHGRAREALAPRLGEKTMSFAAQVHCEDGTIYDIEGEGGNIHAYRITWRPREGLDEAFDTVPEALAAIQVHAGSNVDWD